MSSTAENLACHTLVQIQALLGPHVQIGQLSQDTGLLLARDDLIQHVGEISPKDQERLVDRVDQVYTTVDARNAKCLLLFGTLCSTTKRLPGSTVLSAGLERCGGLAVASGALADVWRGKYQDTQVAIKALRTYSHLETAKEILWKFVPMWKKFDHPSIVTFRGVNMEIFPLALVYDWAGNNNIIRYLESHPGAPRRALLLQAAEGLQYFHSFDIPHGNLKGTNILVDESGHALLTDYGLASLGVSPSVTSTSSTAGNPRWLAPEIINPPHGGVTVASKAADVFAFGMVVAEVMTGKLPFEEMSDSGAAHRILKGERPELPQYTEVNGLTPQLREFVQRCWHQDPTKRPTIYEVVATWKALGGEVCVERRSDDGDYDGVVPGTGDLPDERIDEFQPAPPPAEIERQQAPPNPRRTRNFLKKLLRLPYRIALRLKAQT